MTSRFASKGKRCREIARRYSNTNNDLINTNMAQQRLRGLSIFLIVLGIVLSIISLGIFALYAPIKTTLFGIKISFASLDNPARISLILIMIGIFIRRIINRPIELSTRELTINQKVTFYFSFFLFETILLLGFQVDNLLGLLAIPLIYQLMILIIDNNNALIESLLNKRLFISFLILQGIGWIANIIIKYISISYNMFDTGNFAHVVNNFRKGLSYHYILQEPIFADHFDPNLIILSPFFWLCETILWLPSVRLIAYLSCLLILWKLSQIYIDNLKYRYLVIILWLINFPILNVLHFEFQPSTLAIPFILLSFLLWEKKKYLLFYLDLVFIVGFKENLPLAWLSIGLWLILFKKRNLIGTIVFICGLIVGLTIIYWIIPFLSGGTPFGQLNRFGPLELIPEKIEFTILILFSVGFLPAVNWKILLFILPSFATSLISNTPAMVTLNCHYQDLPMAITFMGLIIGISELEDNNCWANKGNPIYKKVLLIISLLGIIIYNNTYPGRFIRENWPTLSDLSLLKEIHYAKRILNKERTYWCIDSLGVYFINHQYLRSIHDIEAPFHETNKNYIIIADKINHWPIDNNYSVLKDKLELLAKKGQYLRMGDFNRIIIYKSIP